MDTTARKNRTKVGASFFKTIEFSSLLSKNN
jgi:hypothetical protein